MTMRMVAVGGDVGMAIVWGGLSLILAGTLVVSLRGHIGRRSATVLRLAFVGACIGFAIAYVVARQALAGLPHELDGYIDEKAIVWARCLLGGGIGWLIGAASGWFLSRHATGPSREGAWVWGKAVVLVALIAFALMNLAGWESTYYSARRGEPDGILRATTIAMLVAGAALVIVTLLVLAQRNRFRRAGAVVGAVVAVAILATAGARVSSLVPVDRAWLNAWQKGRADAESFAPNLLSQVSQDCPELPAVRGHGGKFALRSPVGHRWLDESVPGWLPDGFGLLTWSRDPILGVWADGRCRLVRLMLVHYYDTPKSRYDRVPNAEKIGSWSVTEHPCPGALATEGLCLEYIAWSQEDGPGEVLSLHLEMSGIHRDVGDRIALGIPVHVLPPEQAWLQRWLTTRQEPLGAARNLITPASTDCDLRIPELDTPPPIDARSGVKFRDERTLATDVPSVRWWINPFAPRWLPPGFGLALDRSWTYPRPRGAWTDGQCREVTLVMVRRDPGDTLAVTLAGVEGEPDGEKVGGWSLIQSPGWCPDPASTCREYQARGSIRGSPATYLLVMRTVGIYADEADRIAYNVPLRDVRYI